MATDSQKIFYLEKEQLCSLHLAGDVELVAIEGDPLQVSKEVFLGRRLRALVCYQPEIVKYSNIDTSDLVGF